MENFGTQKDYENDILTSGRTNDRSIHLKQISTAYSQIADKQFLIKINGSSPSNDEEVVEKITKATFNDPPAANEILQEN